VCVSAEKSKHTNEFLSGSIAVVPILSVEECHGQPTAGAAAPTIHAHDYLLLVFPRLQRLYCPVRCLLPTSKSVPTVAEVAFNLSWWAEVCTQLLAAVKGMHAADVAHCDLKPSNLLLDPVHGRLLLSDLGMARLNGSHAWIPQGTGTMDWCPNEIVKGKGGRAMPADVFAVGLLMCKLLRHVVEGVFFRDEIFHHMDRLPAPRVAHLLCSVVETLPVVSVRSNVSESAAADGPVVSEAKWLEKLEHLLCTLMAEAPLDRPVIAAAQASLEIICNELHQAYPSPPVSLKLDPAALSTGMWRY